MPEIAYYRFEGPDGILGNVVDTSGHSRHHGTIQMGAPTFSRNIRVAQIPQTGTTNRSSMKFGARDRVRFGFAFPFQTEREAPLELWAYPTRKAESAFIWTAIALNSGDSNRFNIGCHGDGAAFIEYREPDGTLHPLTAPDSSVVIPANDWSYIAFVKRDDEYSIYVNNRTTGNATLLASQVRDGDLTDPAGRKPNLPNSKGWTINGRIIMQPKDGFQFTGLLDEIRLSDKALSPAEFLVAEKSGDRE